MNPYVRDTVCTYFAAQTLVAMSVPGYDEVAKAGHRVAYYITPPYCTACASSH